MHRLARLQEVRDKGASAQARRARELITILEVDADDRASASEADALIEAYLHDPYLTKDVGGPGGAR